MIRGVAVTNQGDFGDILCHQGYRVFKGRLAKKRHAHHGLLPGASGNHQHRAFGRKHCLETQRYRPGWNAVIAGAKGAMRQRHNRVVRQVHNARLGTGKLFDAYPVGIKPGASQKAIKPFAPTPAQMVSTPPISSIRLSSASRSLIRGQWRCSRGTFSSGSIRP